MKQKTLQYTVKVYGEGLTEWFYFDWLRTNSHFRFSMEPEIPKNSRSSYKQNLKLIDVELRRKSEERANAILLVIDMDVLAKDKKQYAEYLQRKRHYMKLGVTFIESYPCIELWFLYHFADKFSATRYETYEALRPAIEKVLPGYEKTKKYYQKDRAFQNNILDDVGKRENAMVRGIQSCNYERADGEIVNYTEIFKAIQFFHLIQKFYEAGILLKDAIRKPVLLEQELNGHKSLSAFIVTADKRERLFVLKYDKVQLNCIFHDGASFALDANMPLTFNSPIIEKLKNIAGMMIGD